VSTGWRNRARTEGFDMAPTGFICLLVAGLVWGETSPVDLGAPRLRANADLVPFNPPGPPLSEAVARAGGRGLDFIRFDGLPAAMANGSVVQPYQRLACQADLIVVGHSNASASHLSSFGTAVYSDYDFVVERLLKGSSGAGSDIVVTRLGGALDKVSFSSQDYRAVDALSSFMLVGGEWRDLRKAYTAWNVTEASVRDWVALCAWNR
jgi:hypothetical protein